MSVRLVDTLEITGSERTQTLKLDKLILAEGESV